MRNLTVGDVMINMFDYPAYANTSTSSLKLCVPQKRRHIWLAAPNVLPQRGADINDHAVAKNRALLH